MPPAVDLRRYCPRTRNGPTCQEHIFPCLGLVRKVTQQVRGVVGDDQRHAAVLVHPAPQAGNGRVGVEQQRGGALAECDDELRPDQLDLTFQIRPACGRLVGLGRTVVGRTAFEHVRDVDVATAREPKRGQHIVEQAPRLADEGLAPGILFRARCLADEQPLRVDIADAGDRLVPGPAQAACVAGIDVRGKIGPRQRRDSRFARYAVLRRRGRGADRATGSCSACAAVPPVRRLPAARRRIRGDARSASIRVRPGCRRA